MLLLLHQIDIYFLPHFRAIPTYLPAIFGVVHIGEAEWNNTDSGHKVEIYSSWFGVGSRILGVVIKKGNWKLENIFLDPRARALHIRRSIGCDGDCRAASNPTLFEKLRLQNTNNRRFNRGTRAEPHTSPVQMCAAHHLIYVCQEITCDLSGNSISIVLYPSQMALLPVYVCSYCWTVCVVASCGTGRGYHKTRYLYYYFFSFLHIFCFICGIVAELRIRTT